MKKRFLTFALCTTIALYMTGCMGISDYGNEGISTESTVNTASSEGEEKSSSGKQGDDKEGEADSNATDNDIAEPSQNSEPVNNTDNNENNDESSKSSDDNNENNEDALDASSEVKKILSEMSLEEKITQTLMIDFRKWGSPETDMTVLDPQVKDIISEYDFGAFILFAQNIQETDKTFDLTMALQEAATSDDGIPLLIATDQEGGLVFRLASGTALPGNMALAATADENCAVMAGEIIGSELSVVGINTTLAPVVDINNNANNPVIGLRSFSDSADIVSRFGSAVLKGLDEYNVIGCAKHFPGHGDTDTDSHYGLPVVDKSYDELSANELAPFKALIDNGVGMIMTAHILYPQLDNTTIYSEKTGKEEKRPATMSHKILTDILKGEMGFDGVVITDGMNMEGIAATYSETQAVVEAIAAGADMICMPATGIYRESEMKRIDAIVEAVEKAVDSGYISEERLDDAVTRILNLKEEYGILELDLSKYSKKEAMNIVGSDENRKKERDIAAKAVTVVKNDGDVLPLDIDENSKVLMVAAYNNEKAQLLMGWNRGKQAGLISENAKVKCMNISDDLQTVSGELKENIDWADTVIAISEVGNAGQMAYNSWQSAGVNNIVEYCHKNKKVSVVMSCSNPIDVQLYPEADAVLAVFGNKGSSVDVTEALVGSVTESKQAYGPNLVAGIEVILGVYGASGKLPVNIPEFDAANKSYSSTNMVYERGFGLSYDKK